MQEEVENRTVNLAISTTKLTGRTTKESFEKWYHNQTRYQLAEDRQERS